MNQTRAAHDVAERAARESYGKLLAYLAKRCGGVDAAEEALADAFAAALERWPLDGVPRVPEAWLLVTARNGFFDRARRKRRAGLLHERLVGAARDAQHAFEAATTLDDARLDVMFACAHPAISEAIRAPLILQAVLGLDAARIASAFLVAPATMGQRLVRAKRKIAATRIPFRSPGPAEWPDRLDSVLCAIYAAYGEGWDASGSAEARVRGLATEAIWLGRLLADACPNEPEALGLLALMLHADARGNARRADDGAYVPLERQDVTRWDAAAIAEAEALLVRAASKRSVGRFQLEAAVQSVHAARRFGSAPDWPALVALYDELLRLTGSPVVALNRAVALGRVEGAERGLAALGALDGDERMRTYQPYWAARADLHARAGQSTEARHAFDRAIGLSVDPAVRRYLEAASREEAARGSPRD